MADDKALRRLRRSIAALGLTAVLLIGATAWLVFKPGGPLVADATDTVEIGGPFSLTTHHGETLADVDLEGAPFAVFFGFTHCPEVCPTTLWEMSETLGQLDEEADGFRMLFVSVDPVRDTPELMASYLQSFDDHIVGLTGNETEVAALAKAYRAYWRKVPLENGDYTMDHTASVYLMDAEGRFVGTIAYEEDQETRLAKLRNLLRG
ncbi:SCO family protein [Mesorhizobium sp. CAU 1741]|uniref:SCO family protein n=1 Tax=Mesorhizobium sp. CAU 1741 TaxID=3140366 RepID=UPI00325AA7CF